MGRWLAVRQARCFNPRPSIKTGETALAVVPLAAVAVSIHAHQLRRAKQGPARKLCCHAGFNPRPSIKTGETTGSRRRRRQPAVSIHAHQLRRAKPPWPSAPGWPRPSFNPRPSIKTGETLSEQGRTPPLRRFNPRPSIKTGETAQAQGQLLPPEVSIHAHQLRRAKPEHKQDVREIETFQSTPIN